MDVSQEILAPVTALVLWTFVMWAWMYATRVPAIMKMGMVMDQNLPNGQQMSQLPPRVRWKADNYNHLFEQPVLFYAICFCLALFGRGDGPEPDHRLGVCRHACTSQPASGTLEQN